jgi:hypothetical protein
VGAALSGDSGPTRPQFKNYRYYNELASINDARSGSPDGALLRRVIFHGRLMATRHGPVRASLPARHGCPLHSNILILTLVLALILIFAVTIFLVTARVRYWQMSRS